MTVEHAAEDEPRDGLRLVVGKAGNDVQVEDATSLAGLQVRG